MNPYILLTEHCFLLVVFLQLNLATYNILPVYSLLENYCLGAKCGVGKPFSVPASISFTAGIAYILVIDRLPCLTPGGRVFDRLRS